jgi:hypothetical protein
MAVGSLAPPPLRSRLVDEVGLMTREFNNWLRGLTAAINTASTQATPPIMLTGIVGSIGTSLLVPNAPAGVYRLSYSVRISRAATVSSSIIVTFQWTTAGVVQTFNSPALTGNTTTSLQSGTILASIDGGSLISYSTAYASVGGTTMAYDLALAVEALS